MNSEKKNNIHTYIAYIPQSTLNQEIAWLEGRSDDNSLIKDIVVEHIYDDGRYVQVFARDDGFGERTIDIELHEKNGILLYSEIGLKSLEITSCMNLSDGNTYFFEIAGR